MGVTPILLTVTEHDGALGGSHINVNGETVADAYASETGLLCLFHRRVALRDVGRAIEEVLGALCAADTGVVPGGPISADDVERSITNDVPQLLQRVYECRVRMSDGAVVAVELVAAEVW